MHKQFEFFHPNSNEIRTNIVASSVVATSGVANGRNIPVVVVEDKSNNKIEEIIATHEFVPDGHCNSQWGRGLANNKEIVLKLEFDNPIIRTVIIYFDIIKFGIVVDQILHSQCMYLMTGNKDTKLVDDFNKNRILIEIPVYEFKDEWKSIYKNRFVKYLRKKKNLSKKEAQKIFDSMQQETSILKSFRF